MLWLVSRSLICRNYRMHYVAHLLPISGWALRALFLAQICLVGERCASGPMVLSVMLCVES